MMYVICVVLIGVFILAFTWYPLAYTCDAVGTAVSEIMSSHSGNAAYSLYQQTSLFMTSLWRALPALAMVSLLLWAVIYAQRKSAGGM